MLTPTNHQSPELPSARRSPLNKTWVSIGSILSAVLLLTSCSARRPPARTSGPWNLAVLQQTPVVTWGTFTNRVREVYYEGEPFHGQPTRIFAYYARPDQGPGPFPAMVLVHGGGGKAFADWAEHWARRGYVALAMDLSGNGPKGRLPDGGPDQSDTNKFRPFTPGEANEMWTYHAVAAAIRGHSLLAAQGEVDKNRIGITGISWGGYLTCLIAGLDHRLKVAVPVYGCGFLDQNSVWLPTFEKMSPELRQRWVSFFDPSQYLGGVNCPILFLNGSNDFAYPMDSYQKSYRLVKSPRSLSLRVRLPHGHIWTFNEVDAFVDSQLKGGDPVPVISELELANAVATARFKSKFPVTKTELNYTTDTGPWQKREWQSIPATVQNQTLSARLPAQRPMVCFLSLTDARDVTITTPHVELK